MRRLADALYGMAVALWVGGLWAIGYLAVPVLFAQLADRMLAGRLAGFMFAGIAWAGFACGAGEPCVGLGGATKTGAGLSGVPPVFAWAMGGAKRVGGGAMAMRAGAVFRCVVLGPYAVGGGGTA